MTLHIHYDHSCSNCEAYYIPYDENIPCPNCNLVEEERFDFIPRAVESMQFNKMNGGSYTPGAWLVDSLGDHILKLLFDLFDSYEESQERDLSIDSYASKWLSKLNWGEQAYLEKHLYSIATRIGKIIYRDESSQE